MASGATSANGAASTNGMVPEADAPGGESGGGVSEKIAGNEEKVLSKREAASQFILDELRRYMGEELFSVFQDKRVTEIYVNGHEENVRLDTHTPLGKYISEISFPNERLWQFLQTAATYNRTTLSKAKPVLEGELPERWFSRCRIEGFIPPEVVESPSVVIRKPPTEVYSLQSYVDNGFMTKNVCEQIYQSVDERHNIIVCGGTGSGKTTLTNAIIQSIYERCDGDRLVILEDARELQCDDTIDHQFLRTSTPAGIEIRDLVKYSLRCFPDRIIVGECRDETALDMLDAWSTGHPGGVCTVHADSVLGALERLDSLSQRAQVPPQASLVGRAVDLVVQIKGGNDGRSVPECARVHGFSKEHDAYVLEDIHGREASEMDGALSNLLSSSSAVYVDDYR